MRNITPKSASLRKAVATAVVKVSRGETIEAVRTKTVPKGDVFEFGRAAGLLAIKKTSDVIPDCHPLPVEYASVDYELGELQIKVRVEVHTVYKTGVEVEAMHGASVVALVIYDMLKPIDAVIEIASVKLETKTGGKSGWKKNELHLNCAVVVCSDSIARGENEDRSGKTIINKLQSFHIDTGDYAIIPDDITLIQSAARRYADENYNLIIFTGGTGLSLKDVTPEAIKPLIEKEIPGVMETARRYGQQRVPFAMLSRGVCGFIGNSLVLTLPGSQAGAEETMDALFPSILHVFDIRSGKKH